MKQIVVELAPMGKPRMTQQDRWKKRGCVMRYRAWADQLRLAVAHLVPDDVIGISIVAHVPMPKSWTLKVKRANLGKPCRQKPDIDNIAKAVIDVLVKKDQKVSSISASKRWAIEGRMELLFREA